MSKKILTLLAVAGAVALLAGALYLLKQPVEEPDSESSAESALSEAPLPLLGDGEQKTASRVRISNEAGAFTLLNLPDTEEITIEGLEGLPLNAQDLSFIMTQCASLTAKKQVTERAEDLSLYGLALPRATVEITYPDGSSAALLVGSDAAGNEGSYVMRQGEEAVYLTNTLYTAPFLRSRNEFLDPAILAGIPEEEGGVYAIQRAELGGSLRTEPIVVEATPENATTAAGLTMGTHGITSPIKAGLALDNGLETFGSALGLLASRVEAVLGREGITAADFGLDQPYSTLTLQLPGETVRLLAAAPPDAEGSVLLMREGVDLVYRVPASSLPWLEAGLFQLMDKVILMPHIDRVESIAVRTPGASHTFSLTGEGRDELQVTLDGQPYENTDNFRQFYQTLIIASYSEEAGEELPEGAEPLLEIGYAYRDGSPAQWVRFYPAPARKVFARLNDGRTYYALSSYVDRVAEDLGKMAAGEAVKSYR